MSNDINLAKDDLGEVLRVERRVARCRDDLHLAEHELERIIAHMRLLYAVPHDWQITDWRLGFQPAAENSHAEERGL
jgi:hypothetical protein